MSKNLDTLFESVPARPVLMTCQVLTCVQVPGAPTFPFPSSRLRERRDAWTRFCFGGEEGDEVVDDDAQADDQELTGVCLRHFREEDLLRRQDGGKQEEKYGKLMRAIKKFSVLDHVFDRD